jgi:hypothetical protein
LVDKPNRFILKFLFILFTILSSIVVDGQAKKYAERSLRLIAVFNEKHVAPISNLDTLSSRSFDLLLKKLDRNKIYLNEKDVKSLKKHRFSFLNEFKDEDFSFFIELERTLKRRLSSSLEYMKLVKNKDLWEHQQNRYYEETVRLYAPDEQSRKAELKAYIKSYTILIIKRRIEGV